MHRVDTAGAVNGLFQAGNPGDGTGPTLLGPDWFNDVQENIVNVILAAGLALQKGDYQQLVTAIHALDLQVLTTAEGYTDSQVGALAGRTISGGGLATGGGTLAANRTITVPGASDAEVKALTEAAKVVTPAGLGALFSGNVGASSSLTLPRGLIIKTGTTAVMTGDSTGNVTAFASQFPSSCDQVFLTPLGANGINSGASRYGWTVEGKDKAYFVVTNDSPATAYDYLAFGR